MTYLSSLRFTALTMLDLRMYFLVLCVAFTARSALAAGVVCKNDTTCWGGECCYIKPMFQVVSRRAAQPAVGPVSLPLAGMKHDTGVCEPYHTLHGHCWPLEKANGHCGCPPSTSCQFVPAPTAHHIKRSIYMPGPGTFQCELVK